VAQRAATCNNTKDLYKITRILSKKPFIIDRPVKDKHGKLLVNENEQMQCWKEYFSEMLNKGGNGAEEEQEAEERLEMSKEMIKLKISTDPISKEEIKKGIQKTKAGKAPRVDNINREMIKANANISAEILYPLFGKIWKEEKFPKNGRRGY
jgi:hypothetical protein